MTEAEIEERNRLVFRLRVKEHLTLDAISKVIEPPITRERVRQILVKMGARHTTRPQIRYQIKCLQCGKDVLTKSENQRFCSLSCFVVFHKKYRTREEAEKARRLRNRKHARAYYHDHKDDPHFKEKLREYRQKATKEGYYREYYHNRLLKIQQDPKKYMEYLIKGRIAYKLRIERMRRDEPEKYQALLERQRVWSKRKWERLKADPVAYEKKKQYQRERYQIRMKRKQNET